MPPMTYPGTVLYGCTAVTIQYVRQLSYIMPMGGPFRLALTVVGRSRKARATQLVGGTGPGVPGLRTAAPVRAPKAQEAQSEPGAAAAGITAGITAGA